MTQSLSLRSAVAACAVVAVSIVTFGSAEHIVAAGRASPVEDVIEPRVWPATAWTGNRYFVFGGHRRVPGPDRGDDEEPYRLLNDGALVNPVAGAATELPEAPFARALYEPTALADESSVVVLGTACDSPVLLDPAGVSCHNPKLRAAAFDLRSQRWKRLPAPKPSSAAIAGGARGLGRLSDGRMVFAVITDLPFYPREYWAFAPASASWTYLATSTLRAGGACLRDDRIVALVNDYQAPRTTIVVLDAAAPNGWVESAPDPIAIQEMPSLLCMDDRVMVTRGLGNRVYDLATGEWSWPARAPRPSLGAHAVWTGHVLYFVDSRISYDPVADVWEVGAPASERNFEADARIGGFTRNDLTGVWTGSEVVEYAGGTVSVLHP